MSDSSVFPSLNQKLEARLYICPNQTMVMTRELWVHGRLTNYQLDEESEGLPHSLLPLDLRLLPDLGVAQNLKRVFFYEVNLW
ncbi:unnamed protein product [Victoria cruziana]